MSYPHTLIIRLFVNDVKCHKGLSQRHDRHEFFCKKVRFSPSNEFTIHCLCCILYVVMDVTTRTTSKVEVGGFRGNIAKQKKGDGDAHEFSKKEKNK